MEFSFSSALALRTADKVSAQLTPTGVTIDSLTIDFPGEYEKSGIAVKAVAVTEGIVYRLIIDGKRSAYLDLTSLASKDEIFTAVGDVDLLLVRAHSDLLSLVDEIAPSVVVAFGDALPAQLSAVYESMEKYVTKEGDFSQEITKKVYLQSV